MRTNSTAGHMPLSNFGKRRKARKDCVESFDIFGGRFYNFSGSFTVCLM